MANTLESQSASYRGLTLVWMLTVLALFPILLILGFFMRALQADYMTKLQPEWFYAVMTLHGLGMVGLWFVAGMAGICLIRLRHIRPRVLPWWMGISSENAAHRIAVQWESEGQVREGVYVVRRDTSS